uniref:Arrestin C-terminal-like domain-containing protein n=1 Tax=Plectus sambesii TaxID=2011161 RepID=A0A914W9C1_9BILA
MQIFAIEYDNANHVFFPGQTVTGKVNLHLSNEKKIKGLYLTLFGGALTDWNEGDADPRTDGRRRSRADSNILENRTRASSMLYHRRYRSEQVFIKEKILLIGNGDHEELTVLPPGQHSYPFSFQLPVTALPSFEGWHGHIRYYCKAHIDRPTPHFDKHSKEMFTVAGNYDLRKIPNADVGINVEDVETISSSGLCCGSGSGNISSNTEVRKRAYVPGEVIQLKITIKNKSSRIVKSEKVQMTQNIFYYGTQDGLAYEKQQSINETRIIWEKKEPVSIDPNSESTFTENITIPAVAPTSNNCDIIKIHYSIQCKAAESGIHHSFKTSSLPVIIGTIPLTSGSKETAVFENCVFGKVNVREHDDNEHSHGNFMFSPKYAVYHEQQINQ